MIPFNKPCVTGTEMGAVKQVTEQNKLSGNGPFGDKCTAWFEEKMGGCKAILTPSCTAALEMTALLIKIEEGDEVIMPSYTFVSTANAFVLQGAKIKFVDVTPDTMNMDPQQVRKAITNRTKAVVVVHYAGIPCDMDAIMEMADEYDIWVIEDAAQAMMSKYKGDFLGTIGHMGTYSFHETKNYTCGEGGVLFVNDPNLVERAEILQEKGTDRSQFIKGMVDKYTWRDVGSSYLLSEINAAYLSEQLRQADVINEHRLRIWAMYKEHLFPLAERGYISIPVIPEDCQHNAHMFYIKTKEEKERSELIDHLKNEGIMAVTHYVPLHSSQAGEVFGEFIGEDRYTTSHSERLLRLPLYYGMKDEDVKHVAESVQSFYQN